MRNDEFRHSFSYPLVPTNVPGAYTFPPVPKDLNLKTATRKTLEQYGLQWLAPRTGDSDGVMRAREYLISNGLLVGRESVTTVEVQKGVTHKLQRKPVKRSDGTYAGTVWSGGAIQGGPWVSVAATWNVPFVSQPLEAQGNEGGWNSASWVGLDGDDFRGGTTNDVLQTGIAQKVDANGNASYVPWYEWFAPPEAGSPGYIYQTNIPLTVSAGDSVYCYAEYGTNSQGVRYGFVSFTNTTTGQSQSYTLQPPPGATFNGSTVEWIMEAPDTGYPISALPAFTPVRFTSAVATDSNGNDSNPASADSLNIVYDGAALTLVELATSAVTIYRLPAQEDALPVNNAAVTVRQSGGSWLVVQGNESMLDFGSNQAGAKLAVAIIKHYNFDSQRFVGRPFTSPDIGMMYWTVNGGAPTGAFPGEDAVSFNSETLTVKQEGALWIVSDGTESMLAFPSLTSAVYAIGVIKKYGFSVQCFVARPNPPMTYYR